MCDYGVIGYKAEASGVYPLKFNPDEVKDNPNISRDVVVDYSITDKVIKVKYKNNERMSRLFDICSIVNEVIKRDYLLNVIKVDVEIADKLYDEITQICNHFNQRRLYQLSVCGNITINELNDDVKEDHLTIDDIEYTSSCSNTYLYLSTNDNYIEVLKGVKLVMLLNSNTIVNTINLDLNLLQYTYLKMLA